MHIVKNFPMESIFRNEAELKHVSGHHQCSQQEKHAGTLNSTQIKFLSIVCICYVAHLGQSRKRKKRRVKLNTYLPFKNLASKELDL